MKVQLPSFFNVGDDYLNIPSSYEENIADLKQALNIIVLCRNLTNYSILIKGIDIIENFGELITFEQIISHFELDKQEEEEQGQEQEGGISELKLLLKKNHIIWPVFMNKLVDLEKLLVYIILTDFQMILVLVVVFRNLMVYN